ncbi:MAG: CPBP family intramembrane metalloprotease [Anaerolineales bacterium]|nr:CPBP family intramembrane metalloprotease [Chloroflexota bacterium]MBL6980367.1 CPBP family intramembrane metalloprotease [Anaerolineales bacterium]
MKRIYLLGLILILGSEFLLRDVLLPTPASDIHIVIAISIEWLIFLALMLYWLPKVEMQRLESIGLGKFRGRYIWWGVFAYIFALIASIFSGIALEAVGLEPIRSLQPMIKAFHPLTLLGLFLTGTIVEEVFYRGYLIERLNTITGKRWLAALASWFLFSLVHFKFFGLGPTIDVSILSAVLVLLYLKEKSLWPCFILHGINGLFAYLIFPLLI